jgi:hypothetical protein
MKLETYAKKHGVALRGVGQSEAERLRAEAHWAYLDGRTARARALRAVADRMSRLVAAAEGRS